MLKKCLLVLVAASVVSIAVPFAAAQDNPSQGNPSQGNPSNDQPSRDQQGPASHENGGWRHGPPDPAERTKELTKQLKLTSDQQAKAQDIFQSEHSQMEALRQDSSLSREDRRAKMMDIHKGTDTQVRALLDADQQKKFDEMQAKREQRMHDRRPGPPDAGSGQPGPPPQQ